VKKHPYHFPRSRKIDYARLRLLSRPVIMLPLIVFLVFAVVSIGSSSLAQQALTSTRDHAIERRTQEDQLEFVNKLSAYQLIASGGAGLASVGALSESAWQTFVSAYNIGNNFQAINAITYAAVSGNSLIVTYVSPDHPAFTSRLGLDEYSFPSRKATVMQAAAGKPMLTNQPEFIKPNDEPNGHVQPGFIMFAPIYDTSLPLDTAAQRRAALVGTSNVSFVASRFFYSIYADKESQTHSSPKVYSGGVRPAQGDSFEYTRTIMYDGQPFTYQYQFSNSDLLTRIERDRPIAMLISGIFLGGLLAILMLFGIRSRLHRLTFEKERDVQNAKDELLSLASHQLRTPATGVKQYMGMVLQGYAGDITPQQKEFLEKAYESNERQLHIINDILHLAKLDAGRIVLSKTNFDMSELLLSVLDEQTQSAQEGGITVIKRIPKKLDAYADAHMMRMIVENLVSNAIKYTNPEGKVTVALKSTKEGVVLTVRDTGVGIDDNDLDKLFKQFSRVANERSHLVSGTGVGLYLVKNLIELHGGTIDVVSHVGKGTTFTLALPRML
jgi:signal transduction histidine kinase